MKIGEVSRTLGIPASTIRYYERQGLISAPARVSGQRSFGTSDVTMLRVIKLAQAAGFTITEIRHLFADHSNGASPPEIWAAGAKAKQREVSEKIEALNQVQAILSELLCCECSTLQACADAANERLSC